MIPTPLMATLRRFALPGLLSMFSALSAHAATVQLSAASNAVTLGQTVAIRLQVQDLAAAALSGYALQVGFDASVLHFASFSFTDPVTGRNELDLPEATSLGFLGDVQDLGGGLLDVLGLSGNSASALVAGQADTFRFLTLNFDTQAASAATVVDLRTSQFSDEDGLALDLNWLSTQAAVSISQGGGHTVPEPTTWALGLVALVAAAGHTRRRARRLLATTAVATGTVLCTGAALAQAPAASPASATAGAAVTGVVLQVQGQRLLLRGSDGREQWITTKAKVDSGWVGKRLSGVALSRGDAVAVDQPLITP